MRKKEKIQYRCHFWRHQIWYLRIGKHQCLLSRVSSIRRSLPVLRSSFALFCFFLPLGCVVQLVKMSRSKIGYRFLGKSGLKVSDICLGTMTFGPREVSFALPFMSDNTLGTWCEIYIFQYPDWYQGICPCFPVSDSNSPSHNVFLLRSNLVNPSNHKRSIGKNAI